MGLFNFSSPPTETDKRATDIRTGAVAPKRAERARCWEARDGYFACLDANNIVDALKEEKKAAGVTYFKKWRVQDIQKRARIKELEAQGAHKMDVSSDFAERK
ncbi:hypothetical protein N0V88_005705 [Collariella sp. IMI 366227]|nr:hypothetical protein N0V88_005705 [Collariella sp. IMI 366227]